MGVDIWPSEEAIWMVDRSTLVLRKGGTGQLEPQAENRQNARNLHNKRLWTGDFEDHVHLKGGPEGNCKGSIMPFVSAQLSAEVNALLSIQTYA